MGNNLASLVPRFSGVKINYWSNLMELCFESQDLWRIVEDGVETPENEAQLTHAQKKILKDERPKYRKAVFQIYQAIEVPVYERLTKASSSKKAWEILQTTYSGKDQVKMVRLQSLRDELEKFGDERK